MTNKKLTGAMMVLGLFAVTCGGSVVEREEGDAGSAGQAGSGGTVNKGGSGPSTGGHVSKGGSGPAGSGAYGGYAGTGAQGGWAGGPVCPPVPNCNWCQGKPKYDSAGCVLGWVCANGVDPCYTQPCSQQGCPGGQTCGADGLCWSTNPNTCSPKACTGTGGYCECSWSCGSDKYQTKCKVSGSSMTCECQHNGSDSGACGTAGGYDGGTPASCQNSCCGFPQ